MNSSIESQLDIKNNAEDLQNFLKDIKSWELEMKEMEKKLAGVRTADDKAYPPPRNIAAKRSPTEECKQNDVKKRISAYDYAAWDKFVQKKCLNDSDTDSNSSESEENSNLPSSISTPAEIINNDNKKAGIIKERIECQTSACEGERNIEKTPTSHTLPSGETQEAEQSRVEEQNREQAFFEKELGNKLVAQSKWKEAKSSYTRAIQLDPKNPIYYANRALTHIKLSDLFAAEVDSTTALQLDPTYVKAYQRRGFARMALQQFNEAKVDFEKVLSLEPNNGSALAHLQKIENILTKKGVVQEVAPTFNPKSIFGGQEKTKRTQILNKTINETKVEDAGVKPSQNVKISPSSGSSKEKSSPFKEPLPSTFTPVLPVSKAVHQRSKKPLQRIAVRLVDQSDGPELLNEINFVAPTAVNTDSKLAERPACIVDVESSSAIPLNQTSKSIVSEANKATEPSKTVASEDIRPLNEPTMVATKCSIPPVPQTFLQFQTSLAEVGNSPELGYLFLKSIPVPKLPRIFGSWLDNEILSKIIHCLAISPGIDDHSFLYDFLNGLTHVERFDTLVMLMSSDDSNALTVCFHQLENTVEDTKLRQLKKTFDPFNSC